MKLGLRYIEIGHGTGDNLPPVNNGGWNQQNNFITEFGNKLTDIGIPVGDTQSVSIGFKYIPSGLLIALVKRMEVRGDSSRSNRALWIYVPSQILVSPHEMHNIIEVTKSMFDNPMSFVNNQRFEEAVPEVFRRDFPTAIHPSPSGNMNGDTFAIINCNTEYTPVKILDFGYQNVYATFGIILLNTSGISSPGVAKIDVNSLKKYIWLNWPVRLPETLRGATSVAIYIDRQPMSPTGSFYEVGRHNVMLMQRGFEPVESVITIEETNANKPLDLGSDWQGKKWIKKIDLNGWSITNDQNGSLLREAIFQSPDTITATGEPLPIFRWNDNVFISSENLKNFNLEINCPGYEPLKKHIDLSQQQYVAISLKKLPEPPRPKPSVLPNWDERSHNQFHNENENTNKMTQLMANNQIKLQNQLDKEKKSKKFWMLMACCGFAASILFLILWLTKDRNGEPEDLKILPTQSTQESDISGSNYEIIENELPVNKENTPNDKNEPGQAYGLENAVKYLDSNNTWNFEDLEKYEDLKGLYIAMDTFNWDALANNYGKKLKDSKKFKNIANDAAQNLKEGVVATRNYNIPGVTSIKYKEYTDKIFNLRKEKRAQNKSVGSTQNQNRKPTNNDSKIDQGDL